jgi:hypothetical protein
MVSEADKRRMAELLAASQAYQAKRKKKKEELFVQVPMWWAVEAAKATGLLKMLVLLELVHRSWKARSLTFPFPNGSLREIGVGREAKRRMLRDLEVAGLITVERRHGKTPMVTLVTL